MLQEMMKSLLTVVIGVEEFGSNTAYFLQKYLWAGPLLITLGVFFSFVNFNIIFCETFINTGLCSNRISDAKFV